MITADLKNSILEFAFSGKLTSQLETDTRIDDYYNKIEQKRNELIEQKKVKKLKEINNKHEAPFNIPSNWKWVNLQEIINVRSAVRVHQSDWKKSGVPFYRAREVVKLSVDGFVDNELFISEDLYEKFKESSGVPHENDLLVSGVGTIGKAYIVKKNDKFYYKDASVICFENFYDINPYYLQYLLQAPFMLKQIQKDAMGTTVATLTMDRAYGFLVPLPPIEEQQRIVEKIDYIFDKLDSIEPLEKEIELLKKNFSMDIKKSIFLYAMQGKMSVQSQNESVNTTLCSSLKRDDIPFNIPDNWKWFGHNDMFEVIGGSQPPKSKFSTTKKEGYVQLYQTRDYGPNPQPVYVKKEDVSKFTEKGDIILARYGGSLGKVFWAEDGAYNVALARVFIKFPELINKKFLYYYYLSDLYQSKVKNGNRSAQSGFSKDDLSDLPFPLPPIEEQQRIVNKIEQLLPLCNDIEKIVNS